jgi:hypothetical protein
MITNCRERIIPNTSQDAGFVPEAPPETGSIEKVETKNPWHNHFICMDGESETDVVADDEPFDQHTHWIHILS